MFPLPLTEDTMLTASQWYWYAGIFLACVAMALATAYTAKSGLPWWGLFVALIFSAAFIPVVGTVSALHSSSTLLYSRCCTGSCTAPSGTRRASRTWCRWSEERSSLVNPSRTCACP